MSDIKEVLEERGSRYGEFKDFADISQKLKDIVFSSLYLKEEPEYFKANNIILEGLEMICHKLARIANGDPYYDDSWRDLAGYATLVCSELEKKESEQELNSWEDKCFNCKYCERVLNQERDIDFYICNNINNLIVDEDSMITQQKCEDIGSTCIYQAPVLK